MEFDVISRKLGAFSLQKEQPVAGGHYVKRSVTPNPETRKEKKKEDVSIKNILGKQAWTSKVHLRRPSV
jgi:hypothetical protein